MNEKPKIYSNTLILQESKHERHVAKQAACRKPERTFRNCKVFNTSVDKVVEIKPTACHNFPQFNILARIALLLCNFDFSAPSPITKRKSRHKMPIQYHFGGRSRRILTVCFGSLMSHQRPKLFHPSATTSMSTRPK